MPKVGFIESIISSKIKYGRLYSKGPNKTRIYKESLGDGIALTGIDKDGEIINRVIKDELQKTCSKASGSIQMYAKKGCFYVERTLTADGNKKIFEFSTKDLNGSGKTSKVVFSFNKELVEITDKKSEKTTAIIKDQLINIHAWIMDRLSVQAKRSTSGQYLITDNNISKATLPNEMPNDITNWRKICKLITELVYADKK